MNEFPLAGLFLILFLLILLSGFFSGSETALMTMNRYRLRHRAEQGHRGAKLAKKLLGVQTDSGADNALSQEELRTVVNIGI